MAKDFLTWAKSQAKQHGATSQISNFDKLKSPYSLQGFATWGDVVAGAQQDIENAKKEAERKKAADAAKGAPKISAADMYEAQRESDPIYIQQQIDKWSGLATQWTTGSDHQTALDNLKTWQDKLDAISTTQEQAGQARETAAATKFTEQKLTKDQTDLQKLEAQLNVAKIKRENTTDIQNKIDALTTKISKEKPAPQGPGVVAATGGLTPAPFGGMQNEQGAVQNVKGTGPAPLTPIATGASGAKTPSGTSGGGQYSSKGGVLSYNGQPFSGQYQGKFYSQGKLETPDQVKQDFLANYGVQAALVASDPELSALLTKAITNNYSPARWGVEFQNTEWAKSRTAAQQLSETQRLSKPVMYAESYNNARQRAITLANSLGFDLTETQMGAPIDPAAAQTVHTKDATGQNLAEWIVANNPTDQALQAHLAQVGKINTTLIGGQVQTYAQQLKQQAMNLGLSNYMLPNNTNGDFFTQSAKGIISGTTSLQEQQQYLINEAKKIFPAYAKQLDAGISVTSLAAPYINSLTNLLETTPDQVDLSQQSGYGAMITKALQGNNDPNNPVPMDLGTFANQVRALPQWMNTSNAKTTIMDSGTQFLKSMGLIR
jgi:hypothetical protein